MRPPAKGKGEEQEERTRRTGDRQRISVDTMMASTRNEATVTNNKMMAATDAVLAGDVDTRRYRVLTLSNGLKASTERERGRERESGRERERGRERVREHGEAWGDRDTSWQ